MSYRNKLNKVKSIAKKKNISGEISISTRKGKKYMIVADGKKIHFGSDGMEDFLDHKDEERKKRFHARFKNSPFYNNPESGLYYSQNLLW